MIASRPSVPSARETLAAMARNARLATTSARPGTTPASAAERAADATRRLRQSERRSATTSIQFVDSRVHLQLPAHRPARLRALHDRDGRRQAVRRAEEPEALLLELPRRRRVPREGDQRRSSTTSSPRRSRASSASPRAGTCAAASTPTSSPSTARRDGRRHPRSRCRPRRIRPRPRDVGNSAGARGLGGLGPTRSDNAIGRTRGRSGCARRRLRPQPPPP